MTQVVADVMTPEVSTLGRTTIPRPRAAAPSAFVAPPLAPSSVTVPPAVVPPVADSRPTGSRRGPVWPAVLLDLGLALAVGATAWATGQLPAVAALALAVGWPLMLAGAGRYRHQALGQARSARVSVLAWSGIRAAVLALALAPWLGHADVTGLVAGVAALTVASGVPFLAGRRPRRPRVVLAGRSRDVRDLVAALEASGTHEVVAACLTRTAKEPLGGLPTYVGFASASEIAHRHGADAVVVLPGARLSPPEVRRLHWSLAGVGAELYLGTGLLDVEPTRTRVLSDSGLDVMHVRQPVLHGPRRVVKDVVERAFALVALVLALPLLAVLAVAIRRETPGPALFRQERIGRDGVPFTMLKLRSMGIDAEAVRDGLAAENEKDEVLFKIAQDPRITPLGRRLRKFSLDELPQLWNVVRGDMSLVGPRPALPSEVARYDIDPQRRLVVKPGVTGLWQVSGRSDLSWAESVRLDIKYVDNWSLRLDLSILVRTVRAVLGHHGAY
ncbi:exopolysaccharide biosynthesis polyprenyl glycosylphosphotransferase [Nocardioides cavernae]|uniref:Exopolysaccharide biosynthesis polyprenyl glycosylphosphotransferase n=1 Tax=Nocardioides cavernae TaxID=1921566 RepID=A0A7Y9H042_9ACTN|nr:exopolysaccharide biosynthesis polyprenyl glycosylphosphotransferase [Nocardioides cavernae]NYE35511.1 exopolysaccharide biosynthesis polyprenyl glycosylphosphotransferase [Nocardioides cavernae]